MNNSAASQRARLLAWLKKESITILEAREELDILAPAARVFELRHVCGYPIETNTVTRYTAAGRPHNVAIYHLKTKG